MYVCMCVRAPSNYELLRIVYAICKEKKKTAPNQFYKKRCCGKKRIFVLKWFFDMYIYMYFNMEKY